jgi:hypothetical protein
MALGEERANVLLLACCYQEVCERPGATRRVKDGCVSLFGFGRKLRIHTTDSPEVRPGPAFAKFAQLSRLKAAWCDKIATTRRAVMSITSQIRFVVALLAGAFSTYAQISQASLEGAVKDNTGAAVPGVAVTLRNKGTAATRSIVSDPSGQYSFPNLDPAEYTLSASFKGFKTLVIGSVTLHTGERSSVDVTLQLGETTQEVTVDAAVPLLSTTSAEVSHLVPPSQVAELPLNGRNFWELTQLTPNVSA